MCHRPPTLRRVGPARAAAVAAAAGGAVQWVSGATRMNEVLCGVRGHMTSDEVIGCRAQKYGGLVYEVCIILSFSETQPFEVSLVFSTY